MKPNEKQIKLANLIAAEIGYFATTNDINSPSHWNLIDESIELINNEYNGYDDKYDSISKEDLKLLNVSIGNILTVIRKLK